MYVLYITSDRPRQIDNSFFMSLLLLSGQGSNKRKLKEYYIFFVRLLLIL